MTLAGLVVAIRFHVWAAIDEKPHYAYVQSVAEDHRLPLIDDVVSEEAQAISDGTWPGPPEADPATLGFVGRSYEAFQPPLYYVAAAPVFAVVGDHRDKIFALRIFDAALYLAGAALLWMLAVRLTGTHRPWLAWSAGLLVLAWPGLVARGVTVSNSALEFALVPGFELAAWRAYSERSVRWLAIAGGVLGLCLLTKLTLAFLVPSFLLAAVAVWRARSSLVGLAAALVLPGVLVAPWLIANHERIGSWTANAIARAQQTPVLFPSGRPDWGLSDLPRRSAELLKGALPQEWYGQLDVWWIAIAARGLVLAFVGLAVLACLRARSQDRALLAFFVAPVVCGLLLMAYTLVAEDWDVFLLRYVAPALAPLAVAGAVVLGRDRPRFARATAVLATVVLGALWVDMAGAFMFTDIGDALGI